MSRIGKMKIDVPAGVTVSYENKIVTVKGPKGELTQKIESKDIDVKIEGTVVSVERANDTQAAKSMHGLYRQLVANMVKGVVTPFSKTLVVVGVGYKVAVAGSKLTMNIGYSHPVEFIAPEGITITCPDLNTVVVTGINKELVGHVAADIRAKRKVEPYHGYGLHYSDEVDVRKEGKKGAK